MISVRGEIAVASDKSISHRGIMLGSIADGITKIENFLMGEDCLSTIECFRKLGIKIDVSENEVLVHGKGMAGLIGTAEQLDAGNSGTTTRLLTGLLSGYNFTSVINGDSSLQKRPMKRIIEPLSLMGADICAVDGNFCPLTINGGGLVSIDYTLPVASAQIKSGIILAALNAEGTTNITEPQKSRDHTENMLAAMGGNIKRDGNIISVSKTEKLVSSEITVPGDISSAAFFIVLALISKNSELIIRDVGINETRTGIIDVLLKMGGDIRLENKRIICGEPIADIVVKSSDLKAVEVGGDIIPRLIDEVPILAVAFAFADGKSRISGAKELRVKESDRIKTVLEMLNTANVQTEEFEDGFSVFGTDVVSGGRFMSYMDHRIAMSAKVLSLMARGESFIDGFDCVNVSYPDFLATLDKILVKF